SPSMAGKREVLLTDEQCKTVLCDRFLLANIAYQGHASGIDLEDVRSVGNGRTSRFRHRRNDADRH
ncbi:hypothetical protein AB1L30_23180, partial [Bremerella sp. JC817]